MKFSEFLKKEFEKWDAGRDLKLKNFAAYLGVPQTSLSNWMNGGYTPGGANLLILVEKLGAHGLPKKGK